MAGALLLLIIGVLFFTQTAVGDAVTRLGSFAPWGQEPAKAGPRSSAFTPRGTKSSRFLKVRVGVPRGAPIVYSTIAAACERANIRCTCTSWYRPGSNVQGNPGNPSCHRGGPNDAFGAMDLKPVSGKPEDLDRLERELRKTPGIGEIVWRGDSDHDPAAGAGSSWHLHAAVNCG